MHSKTACQQKICPFFRFFLLLWCSAYYLSIRRAEKTLIGAWRGHKRISKEISLNFLFMVQTWPQFLIFYNIPKNLALT